jgi:DNA-binding NarL/FixJ family response regulator
MHISQERSLNSSSCEKEGPSNSDASCEHCNLNASLGALNRNIVTTAADVIERLLILAVSIALDSRDELILQRSISLLSSLLELLESKELPSVTTSRVAPSSVINMNSSTKVRSILTLRQREVLRLRSMGLGVPEIAERLHLTPHTVQSHIRDAIERLGVSGGAIGAIAEARQRRLI